MEVLLTPQMPIREDATGARWAEQRLRRRLMEGGWRGDLYDRARLLVGRIRQEAWGYLDMSANPLLQLASQFATLYDHEPQPNHALATEADLAVIEEALLDSGFWAFMQRVQRDAIALRDMFVGFDVDEDGQLVHEQIWPGGVGEVRYDAAGRRIVYIEHLRLRHDERGREAWFWDVLTVEGGVGRWSVAKDAHGRPGADVSPAYLRRADGSAAPAGGLAGSDYPYLREGVPYVPVVRYRAQVLGRRRWDWLTWKEVVEGTLNVSVYWSMWGHVLRAASWPQRYTVGCHVVGVGVHAGSGSRSEIVTDPAVLLRLVRDDDFDGQPIVSQFSPAGDPSAMAESISVYEARIAAGVGVTSSDLTRTSDPRSGYSLAVSRDAQREQQRRLKPAFRQGDRVALEVMTALLNGSLGTQLPTRGWRLEYVGLPLSAAERRAVLDEVFELLDRGFIDEVEAMRRISGHEMTRTEAVRELERIRAGSEPSPTPEDDR